MPTFRMLVFGGVPLVDRFEVYNSANQWNNSAV
jgi:hypothetical protein